MSPSTAQIFKDHDNELLAYFSLQIQRNLKQKPILGCDNCRNVIARRKLCADCKQVFYCSEECQKADWPIHRKACTLRTISTRRYVPALSHNSIIMALFSAIFITEFNLTEQAPGPSSGPFILGVSLGMLPPGWRTLDYNSNTLPALPPLHITPPDFSLFQRKPQKSGIEVFLQIFHFTIPPKEYVKQFESVHNTLWVEDTVKKATKPTTDPMQFAGVLMVCHGGDSLRDFNNVFPIRIKKSDLEGYKTGALFSAAERALGEPVPRPLAVDTLYQYINRHIEADLANCFRLRRRLRCNEQALVSWARDALSSISRRQVTTEEVLKRLKVFFPNGSEMPLGKRKLRSKARHT